MANGNRQIVFVDQQCFAQIAIKGLCLRVAILLQKQGGCCCNAGIPAGTGQHLCQRPLRPQMLLIIGLCIGKGAVHRHITANLCQVFQPSRNPFTLSSVLLVMPLSGCACVYCPVVNACSCNSNRANKRPRTDPETCPQARGRGFTRSSALNAPLSSCLATAGHH